MCLYPKLITNRKYLANKKNGGVIPVMKDQRVKTVPVGCGNCMECRGQKARAWQVRLLEDIKEHKNGKFVTFTFSNESIKHLGERVREDGYELEGYELDNAIATKAMRLFLERWRKKYKKSLRHWTVTELGHNGTENIHLHGIVWTNEDLREVQRIWNYGHVWTGQMKNGRIINYVNEATVNYSVKYVSQIDENHKYYKSIVLTSPGIGKNYTEGYDSQRNKFNGRETIETYRTRTGHKISMPIYWRNKIYTEWEKEQLWLYRLDKEERWVCGEKVKASDNKGYWGLLQWHRKRNIQLGYGNDEKDWNREQYEIQRRKLMHQMRIAAAEKNYTVIHEVREEGRKMYVDVNTGELIMEECTILH